MLHILENIFKPFALQNELEHYISAHNPTNAADVERLIKEYTYRNLRIWI